MVYIKNFTKNPAQWALNVALVGIFTLMSLSEASSSGFFGRKKGNTQGIQQKQGFFPQGSQSSAPTRTNPQSVVPYNPLQRLSQQQVLPQQQLQQNLPLKQPQGLPTSQQTPMGVVGKGRTGQAFGTFAGSRPAGAVAAIPDAQFENRVCFSALHCNDLKDFRNKCLKKQISKKLKADDNREPTEQEYKQIAATLLKKARAAGKGKKEFGGRYANCIKKAIAEARKEKELGQGEFYAFLESVGFFAPTGTPGGQQLASGTQGTGGPQPTTGFPLNPMGGYGQQGMQPQQQGQQQGMMAKTQQGLGTTLGILGLGSQVASTLNPNQQRTRQQQQGVGYGQQQRQGFPPQQGMQPQQQGMMGRTQQGLGTAMNLLNTGQQLSSALNPNQQQGMRQQGQGFPPQQGMQPQQQGMMGRTQQGLGAALNVLGTGSQLMGALNPNQRRTQRQGMGFGQQQQGQGFGPQQGQHPQAGFPPQPGIRPQQSTQQQGMGFGQQQQGQGFGPQQGQHPQAGFPPQPGMRPQQGTQQQGMGFGQQPQQTQFGQPQGAPSPQQHMSRMGQQGQFSQGQFSQIPSYPGSFEPSAPPYQDLFPPSSTYPGGFEPSAPPMESTLPEPPPLNTPPPFIFS